MKKLIILGIATLLCSCTWNKINLKPGQEFTHHFGYGTKTFICKKVLPNGVLATMSSWVWSENEFISNYALQTDEEYVELGMYPGYGNGTKKLDNPLMHLKKGNKFQMIVAGSLETFIVAETDTDRILVKVPELTVQQWSMDIPFTNYNPHFFKRLTK